jgi:zinc protease
MTRRQLLALSATGAFGSERLNRAPISRDPLRVKLPQAQPVKLANGLQVLALEDDRLPIATVLFQVEGAGPIYSPRPGVAELTAEMLVEGAAGRSGKQIADEAARLGASISSVASSGAETITIEGSGLTSHFPEWLALQSSVLLQPTFPADEFSSLRQRKTVEARLRLTRPATVAFETAQRIIYGSHPAAVAAPPPEALASLTPEALASWHRSRYTPGKTLASCIGRVKPSTFVAQVEKLVGSWKAPDVSVELPPTPQPQAARRVVIVDRPGAVQTELVIGNLIFDRRDPDLFPFVVANTVFAGGGSSRLYRILRAEKGYVFTVGSEYSSTRFPGFFRVRAGTRTDATVDTVLIVLDQLQRLCDEPIPAAELDAGKRAVVGNFAMTLERPGAVLNQSGLRYRYGFSVDYWERYPARMMAVTPGEAQAVAQKYMDPRRVLIVAWATRPRSGPGWRSSTPKSPEPRARCAKSSRPESDRSRP